jgi:hypothetical protein
VLALVRFELLAIRVKSAAAWSLAPRAQQPAMIGFLHPSSAEAYASLMLAAFRSDDHYHRLPALAVELVGQGVSVIATANATANWFCPASFFARIPPLLSSILSSETAQRRSTTRKCPSS